MRKNYPIITFEYPDEDNKERLKIIVETERLLIRSVTPEDADNYCALFADPNVMAKYATGKPITDRDRITDRINGWHERWGKNDPFNGMAVFLKDTDEFVGHVVVGRSGFDGISELAGLGYNQHWNNGLGKEAGVAVVNHLVPMICKMDFQLDGHDLTQIIATARIDHESSQKIMRALGMEPDDEINEKFGAQRYIFRVTVEKLLQMQQQEEEKEELQESGDVVVEVGDFDAFVKDSIREVAGMSDQDVVSKFGASETARLSAKNVFEEIREHSEKGGSEEVKDVGLNN